MTTSNGLTLTRYAWGYPSETDRSSLKANGWSYSQTEKGWFKLEVASGFSPTLADAVKIGALQVAYEDGKCVMTPIAYFAGVRDMLLKPDGYTYDWTNKKWCKPMTPTDFQELQSFAPRTEWEMQYDQVQETVERKISNRKMSILQREQWGLSPEEKKYQTWLAPNKDFIASLPIHPPAVTPGQPVRAPVLPLKP